MMKRWLVLVAVVGLALAGSSASGGLVLDQSQEVGQFMVPIWYNPEVAQTFTAGISGRLDSIELAVVPWHPQIDMLVEIRDTQASAPGNTLLGGVVASVPEAAVWTSIDLRSQNISLTAGEMYSIVLPHSAWGLSQPEDTHLYAQVESGTGGELKECGTFFGPRSHGDGGNLDFRRRGLHCWEPFGGGGG